MGGAVFVRYGARGSHIETPFTLNENEDLAWALTASVATASGKIEAASAFVEPGRSAATSDEAPHGQDKPEDRT